jgi:cytidylate kinase
VPVDLEADKILLEEVDKGEVVIDSWSLPWLTGKGLRIHLLADLTVRAKRAAERGGIPYQNALERISAKDEQTRQLFLRLYGFDIKKDHHVFGYTLDTHELSQAEVLARACHELRRQWSTLGDAEHAARPSIP